MQMRTVQTVRACSWEMDLESEERHLLVVVAEVNLAESLLLVVEVVQALPLEPQREVAAAALVVVVVLEDPVETLLVADSLASVAMRVMMMTMTPTRGRRQIQHHLSHLTATTRKEPRKFGPQYLRQGMKQGTTYPPMTESYLLSM